MKLATPLPFRIIEPQSNFERGRIPIRDAGNKTVAYILGPDKHKHAAYIVHACNAYPQLVEAMRSIVDNDPTLQRQARQDSIDRASALLRSLGEDG